MREHSAEHLKNEGGFLGRNCLVFVVLLLTFLVSSAFGEEVKVQAFDADVESRKIELKEGQTAELIVYLKSAGEMLDGFRLFLLRDPANTLIATERSDETGVITFGDLAAGEYTVLLRKNKTQKYRYPTVEIGDIRLQPSPPIGSASKASRMKPKTDASEESRESE